MPAETVQGEMSEVKVQGEMTEGAVQGEMTVALIRGMAVHGGVAVAHIRAVVEGDVAAAQMPAGTEPKGAAVVGTSWQRRGACWAKGRLMRRR